MAGASSGSVQMVAAVIVRDGLFLMGLRGKLKRSAPGCWDLIGGHVEPGESLAGALAREIEEELGLVPIDPEPMTRLEFDDAGDGPSTLHFYRVEHWRGGEPRIANDEHVALNRFRADQVQALPNLALAEYRTILAGE